ncbi:MAG: hypothetical protein V2A61_06990, partial [Calditrichota bacterium]
FSGRADIDVDDCGLNMALQLDYRYKVFFLQEIYALTAASGCFEIADIFGDYNIDCQYRTAKNPEQMIVVLKKMVRKP